MGVEGLKIGWSNHFFWIYRGMDPYWNWTYKETWLPICPLTFRFFKGVPSTFLWLFYPLWILAIRMWNWNLKEGWEKNKRHCAIDRGFNFWNDGFFVVFRNDQGSFWMNLWWYLLLAPRTQDQFIFQMQQATRKRLLRLKLRQNYKLKEFYNVKLASFSLYFSSLKLLLSVEFHA